MEDLILSTEAFERIEKGRKLLLTQEGRDRVARKYETAENLRKLLDMAHFSEGQDLAEEELSE